MSSKHCDNELCSNWAFVGGLCRKHAALKLLSAPTSPSVGKPTPMELYRKTVHLPSASRAHYEAVLSNIDHVLAVQIAPRTSNVAPSSNVATASTIPNIASKHVDGNLECIAPAVVHNQISPTLSRSAIARFAPVHDANSEQKLQFLIIRHMNLTPTLNVIHTRYSLANPSVFISPHD